MKYCLSALLFLGVAAHAAEDDDRAQAARIARLIEQLDADSFELREQAERDLMKAGLPALGPLENARQSRSAEVRSRARRIHARIQSEHFTEAFRKLVAVESDQQIDLERAMFLIAATLDPSVNEKDIDRQLDALADAVRAKFNGQQPAKADPREVVQAIRDVLFVQAGFTGNRADYDAPANSSIAYVLKEKKGLPILLSHLVVAVADRLQVPIVGIPVPSQYMVKYDSARVPRGAGHDIILNPFDDFRELSKDDLKRFLAERGFEFDPIEHLSPSTHHATVSRMLVNLVNDLQQAGKSEQAEQIQRYRDIVLQRTFDGGSP